MNAPARLRTVGVSFGLSVGIHLLLLGLLVTSFSRSALRAPLVVQRVRLVYVDPAPAAAPPRGVEDGAATAAPIVAPPPPVPVQAQPAPKPALAEKKIAKPKPTPAAAPPHPVEPARVETAAVAPTLDAPAGVANGMTGAAGDAVGGTAAGGEGGRVGGGGSDVRRLGDVATAPVLVTRVVPEYPRSARLAGIEGEVVLEVVVDRYGRVADEPRVIATVPELERAAIGAVRRWRFRPAREHDGTPVAVLMEVPVRFVLHEAAANGSR